MIRVLVINDSQFERIIMKDIVSRLGYDVKTADEYDSLSLVEKYNPDIVITNMNMNETSGDRLIKTIKEKKPDMKCYLSSCSEIEPDKLHYKGIDGLFQTPITPSGLEKVLNDDRCLNLHEQNSSINMGLNVQSNKQAVMTVERDGKIPDNKRTGQEKVNEIDSEDQHIAYAFCPYCGKKVADTSVKYIFCPYCGSKF